LITGNNRIVTFQRIWTDLALPRALPALGLALPLLLGACAEKGATGKIGLVEGFAGVVAADEPRATVIGRDILGNGGTAIDAAVAMYFTMAVTLPSRVGLGGGGVCVIYDGKLKRGEAIEFLPRSAPSGGMVPSNMRAMAAMHARNGTLRWERLLAPAESMARFGHPVSRAFARDLAAAAEFIAASPDLSRLFATRDGRLAKTGDKILQPELSAVLGGIRRQGAPYLHGGPFAARLAEASSAAGLPLTAEDVRRNVPRLVEAMAMAANKRDVAYFSPPRAAGGVVGAQIWGLLTGASDYAGAGEDEKEHLFAEAALRAYAERSKWMQPDGSSSVSLEALADPGRLDRMMADYDPQRHTPAASFTPPPQEISTQAYSAGFVVGDQYSNAVACNFTMNRLFGSGRVAVGTGIILAAPPRSQNDGSTSLAAVIVGNTATGDVRFAGVGGGGPVGTTALARVMLDTVAGEESLSQAISKPRVHTNGAPDAVLHEITMAKPARDALARRGHSLRAVSALGHVNAIYCSLGLKDRGGTCEVASDPRGYGLAQMAQ
jgi:gamma-glutamyltranspeptidase / glutathione hydrolase